MVTAKVDLHRRPKVERHLSPDEIVAVTSAVAGETDPNAPWRDEGAEWWFRSGNHGLNVVAANGVPSGATRSQRRPIRYTNPGSPRSSASQTCVFTSTVLSSTSLSTPSSLIAVPRLEITFLLTTLFVATTVTHVGPQQRSWLSTTNDPSLARTAQAVPTPDVIKLFRTMTPLSILIVPSMTELVRTCPPPKRSREPVIRMESINERPPPPNNARPVVLRRPFFTVAESPSIAQQDSKHPKARNLACRGSRCPPRSLGAVAEGQCQSTGVPVPIEDVESGLADAEGSA